LSKNQRSVKETVTKEMFAKATPTIQANSHWQQIQYAMQNFIDWNDASNLKKPPFFE